MQALIARCKQDLAKLRIIQEKATREIIYRLFGLGKKLICKEGNIVTSLFKQFRKEGIIAPFAFLSDNMHGQNILKDKACQVPTRYHIAELCQQSALFELQLTGGCGIAVAVKLRVNFAIAFADNQHNIRRTVRTRIDFHRFCSHNTSVNLL